MPPAAADPNSMSRLLIPAIVVPPLLCCSFASAFNSAGRKPGDKMLLRDEGENDHRQDDQHAGCREPTPVYTRIARVEPRHHTPPCLRPLFAQPPPAPKNLPPQ